VQQEDQQAGKDKNSHQYDKHGTQNSTELHLANIVGNECHGAVHGKKKCIPGILFKPTHYYLFGKIYPLL
jgi:hypothetical protein